MLGFRLPFTKAFSSIQFSPSYWTCLPRLRRLHSVPLFSFGTINLSHVLLLSFAFIFFSGDNFLSNLQTHTARTFMLFSGIDSVTRFCCCRPPIRDKRDKFSRSSQFNYKNLLAVIFNWQITLNYQHKHSDGICMANDDWIPYWLLNTTAKQQQ